jgi:molybdopterin/thiamine biosynthesis adenylyltransferase
VLTFVKRVVIVGSGGIGSWLIAPVVRFLCANNFEGEINIWDGDHYTSKNAERQEFAIDHVNFNKAEAAVEKLRYEYPQLNVFGYNEFVIDRNIERAIKENDLVFVCVDNHPARVLISKRAQGLKTVCIISSGNEYFDGNAHVHLRVNNKDITKTFIERHPECLNVKAGDRAEAGCEDLIKEGATQLLVTNFMAAASCLMAFHNLWVHGNRHGRTKMTMIPQEIYFDINSSRIEAIPVGE